MGNWLHHWFWIDFWTPVWPNLVASLVVYVFVFLKMRTITDLHKEQVRLHDELKNLQVRHHGEHMQMLKELRKPGE